MAISMLKIRRPLGRLIFNMGIAIPGKTVFLIETAPKTHFRNTKEICLKIRFEKVRLVCTRRHFITTTEGYFMKTIRKSSRGLYI